MLAIGVLFVCFCIVFVKLSFYFSLLKIFIMVGCSALPLYYSSDFIQTLLVSSLVVSCTPRSNPVFHNALSCNSGDSFFSLYFVCDLDNLEETVQIYYRMFLIWISVGNFMVRPGSWILWRDSTEIIYCSHYDVPTSYWEVDVTNWYVTFDHLFKTPPINFNSKVSVFHFCILFFESDSLRIPRSSLYLRARDRV